ncbi:MAG: hypothetical protein M3271_04515 [Actinomycetota bacterium]|nr:hypothetical protein [Actinomycetota bacterium]
MTAGDGAVVLGQLLACALVGWSTAALLLRWARLDGLGLPERMAATVVGFLCFAVVALLLNIVAGGAVFGTAGVIPVLACLPVAGWAAGGLGRADLTDLRRTRRWTGALLLGVVLGALYVSPMLLEGSGVRTGDPPWHLGWTEQLLGGERVPVGPAADFARNAYPWGYHAFLATLVRLVPGSTPLLAHEAVHVMLLLAIPLTAACLARRVDRRTGLAAAACTSLVGGFGWVMAREPAFVGSPRASRYGADLVTASPNSVYELLPPALPRELGLVVAGVAAVVLLLALERDARRARVAAGVVGGLVGVVSVPMLFTALAWAVVACLFVRARGGRAFLEVVVPALAVFALWAGPVAFGYLQHGGFVDITPRLGMEWPLPTALGSYGLLLPLALAGAVLWRRTALVALMGGSAVLLGLAVAREVFGWSVWNNATLLHQGRMWPPVHLLAGALGGLAVVRLYALVRRRSRALAVAAVGAGLAVAAASPVLASGGMRAMLDEHREGYEYGSDAYADGSFLRDAAAQLDPDDVVAGGSDRLLWGLFQFSGCRLAQYDDPRFEGNDLRIRYADLASRWDDAVATQGFEPSHVVVSGLALRPPGRALAGGWFDGDYWVLIELE